MGKGMGGPSVPLYALLGLVAVQLCLWVGNVSWYQMTTAATGVRNLLNLPQEDIDKCIAAYQYLQNGTRQSNTEEETEHVRAYYAVINQVLAIADIEKMYIPPHINSKEGLYINQLQWEKEVFETLKVKGPNTRMLDIGCGRGRISHYFAKMSGGRVSGFNIDENQVQNGREYAKEEGMEHQLDFKQGDHHKRFAYPDNTFDGSYSFQAIWPFYKIHELDATTREMFRVMKPGARYTCSEYLLTPEFRWNDTKHNRLHSLFLPTLAATQSMYPVDVTSSLERAGFKVIKSAPSPAPAWPLTDQKTDLFLFMRSIVKGLTFVGLSPVWVETLIDNLLLGGQAWAEAEKMKIADLNWVIIVEKPRKPLKSLGSA